MGLLYYLVCLELVFFIAYCIGVNMLDMLFFGLVIGFVFGYFSQNWNWSKKIADWLDKLLKR
jgi:hypothetical protein